MALPEGGRRSQVVRQCHKSDGPYQREGEGVRLLDSAMREMGHTREREKKPGLSDSAMREIGHTREREKKPGC